METVHNFLFWILKIVTVIGLLGVAAVMATPRGRLPLALRGLKRMLDRDRGGGGRASPDGTGERPSTVRRLVAFSLVLLALLVAVL